MSAATVSLSFPVEALEPSGLPEDGRLSATVTMLGCWFHVEAVPVIDVDGLQTGADAVSESRLSALAVEFDAPGFETVRIGGHHYALFFTPFGR
jgi:hypothetical protein